jgi:outer membrane protein assembly factor BamD (BamD/ComL family)
MLAFDDAWRAMRANDFRAAAAAFDRAALSDDAGPLAEDARFWRAAALARANRSADAIAAFTSFLDRHPRSVRAGEASTMLGWLLLDRATASAPPSSATSADLDRAAALFTSATRDPSARVRDSATRGLRAVGAASAAK